MRVLVTGGSGFLGAWIAKQLVRQGHRVTTLSRRPKAVAGIGHVAADILDRRGLSKATRHCDAIINVAGMVSLQPAAREQLFRVNVEGTRNVLEAASDAKVRVIHVSSIATLGYTDTQRVQDETDQLRPDDRVRYPYAASKWQAEQLALQFAEQGLDVVIVNPGYLLGPGDESLTSTRLLFQYVRGDVWLYPPGGISFADVRDVAAAVATALAHGTAGERYALGGHNLSYGELFAKLHHLTGVRRLLAAPRGVGLLGAFAAQLAGVFVPHPFRELNLVSWQFACRFNYCDVTKARSRLAYQPRNFEETLRDTVCDHLARGIVQGATPELAALRSPDSKAHWGGAAADSAPTQRN